MNCRQKQPNTSRGRCHHWAEGRADGFCVRIGWNGLAGRELGRSPLKLNTRPEIEGQICSPREVAIS
jgi:hypothetical protein